jgi:sensor c-di-GMP phosphodiesterase-like protein
VHTIKIDQSFVREIHSENGHYPVILAIISIARGLGLKLVAEGVETQAQASYLMHAGCRILQGFLFHKALPQKEFIRLLEKQEQEYPVFPREPKNHLKKNIALND